MSCTYLKRMHEVQRLTSTSLRDIPDWINYGRVILSVHVHVWHGDHEQNVYMCSIVTNGHCFFADFRTKARNLITIITYLAWHSCFIHILSSHEYLVNLSMSIIALRAYASNKCINNEPKVSPATLRK